MARVKISSLRKSFGKAEILHGVDVDIDDREFVALVGPSGCGKSTLLRMVAGLEDVTAGEIHIGDRLVNLVPPKGRDVAMVFQNYALYPHMTVEKNMGFALRLSGVPKPEIERRVAESAEILSLTPLLKRLPRQLSGGQRQRVAMGRAIVRNPQVFLFDEPLSNLDAKLRVKVRAEIKELHQRIKTTTIYVTHDQVEAMTMADKIVVMRDGYIEQAGRPADLYDNPRNTFVAGFIGSPAMNLISGTVADGVFKTRAGTELSGALPKGIELGDALLGVRPEDLTIVDGPGELTIPLRVRVVEPTGPEVQVLADFDGNEVTAAVRGRQDFRRGEVIHFALARNKLHLFDARDGQRVDSMAPLSTAA